MDQDVEVMPGTALTYYCRQINDTTFLVRSGRLSRSRFGLVYAVKRVPQEVRRHYNLFEWGSDIEISGVRWSYIKMWRKSLANRIILYGESEHE